MKGVICVYFLLLAFRANADSAQKPDYGRSRWDPLHFPPLIGQAQDKDCLSCHQEVLTQKTREKTLKGTKKEGKPAWYQTLDTYSGEQLTFHQRHLQSPYALEVMQLKCTSCHQGNDPREEAINPPNEERQEFTLRKMVNPEVCLMCHGKFPYEVMGLSDSWEKVRDSFGNNCLLCHTNIRTTRHQVNFLKPEKIESWGQKTGDSCFGCHGGRSWYRKSFAYPRHPWPNMPDQIPDWAKTRPLESVPRFRP